MTKKHNKTAKWIRVQKANRNEKRETEKMTQMKFVGTKFHWLQEPLGVFVLRDEKPRLFWQPKSKQRKN